uniref:Uncharacterized protein n=1 Tax=Anguilla anguilla TaxID=7936 RepID=A0A0E9WB70_ANGAN
MTCYQATAEQIGFHLPLKIILGSVANYWQQRAKFILTEGNPSTSNKLKQQHVQFNTGI